MLLIYDVCCEFRQKLVLLQDALEDLSQQLLSLERETMRWKPVNDVVVDDLQNQIDSTLVSILNVCANCVNKQVLW